MVLLMLATIWSIGLFLAKYFLVSVNSIWGFAIISSNYFFKDWLMSFSVQTRLIKTVCYQKLTSFDEKKPHSTDVEGMVR